MAQQGQVFELSRRGANDRTVWAYRYRMGGRGSRRVQRGGFASEQAAAAALERALEQLHREQGLVESPTLTEFVEVYLAQHEGEPETTEKLRWLLAKAVRVFGERRLSELRSPAIVAWRMTIPPGHRFEATQALRQVLARAVSWGLRNEHEGERECFRPHERTRCECRPRRQRASGQRPLERDDDEGVNPAKLGVENPQRRYTEKRPFESWDELYALADRLGPLHGPMVLFAAATGLRPGEWLALEHRDVDREGQVLYVRRTFRNGRIKTPKTKASVRAVPLQAIALAALDELRGPDPECPLLFPSANGGYFDLHNFRNRSWRPGQKAAGITPLRRVYDLRHTFATFALRAGISTFDLSRYMGTSLAMIDRHYGHLARDGREHAIRLPTGTRPPRRSTSTRWTLGGR